MYQIKTSPLTHKTLIFIFFFILVLARSFTSFAAELPSELEALSGKTAGVLSGTPQDGVIKSTFSDVKIDYYNSFADLYLALNQGKIDFYINNTMSIPFIQQEYPDFTYIDYALTNYDVADACIKCGKCEEICPQQINIIKNLADCAKEFKA